MIYIMMVSILIFLWLSTSLNRCIAGTNFVSDTCLSGLLGIIIVILAYFSHYGSLHLGQLLIDRFQDNIKSQALISLSVGSFISCIGISITWIYLLSPLRAFYGHQFELIFGYLFPCLWFELAIFKPSFPLNSDELNFSTKPFIHALDKHFYLHSNYYEAIISTCIIISMYIAIHFVNCKYILRLKNSPYKKTLRMSSFLLLNFVGLFFLEII
jgi:hypothetical protein